MSVRAQDLAAERAGRPTRRKQRADARHERNGDRRRDAHPEQVGLVRVARTSLGSVLVGFGRSRLDDDSLARCVPSQRHAAHPERIDERLLQVVGGHVAISDIGTDTIGLDDVEQVAKTLGQGRYLHLLEGDTHEGATLTGLQKEGARTWRTDRARHESVGVIKFKEATRHGRHRIANAPLEWNSSMANRLRPPRLGLRPDRRPQARPMAMPRSSAPPRGARVWLGWLAAGTAILTIAFIAGRAGSDVELVSPTPSPSTAEPVAIVFGSALDEVSGVAVSPTTIFRAGDPFAYSARLPAAAGTNSMLLEVVRLEADGQTTAQAQREVGIDATSRVIAFSVFASDLLAAWGPGNYEMRMYLEPGTDPTALGRFTLAEAPASG